MTNDDLLRMREAFQSKDVSRYGGLLAEDIEFLTPIEEEPVRGHQAVLGLLGVVFDLFADFRYTDHAVNGSWAVLYFHATVAGTPLGGVDLLRLNPTGNAPKWAI